MLSIHGGLQAQAVSTTDALQAVMRPAAAAPPQPGLCVELAGGGGALGASMLQALLSDGRFGSVQVWVQRPLEAWVPRLVTRMRGESPVADDRSAATPRVAVMVFDRVQSRTGREAAFWMPGPDDLLPWARERLANGVQTLVVVRPVDMARWPAALRDGLATLDEQAVAALDWRHLVWVRPARNPAPSRAIGLQRVADQVLAQLRFMVPTAHQPLRTAALCRVLATVASSLPNGPPGTRVLGADTLWQLVQAADPEPGVQAWWAGKPLPDLRAAPRRL